MAPADKGRLPLEAFVPEWGLWVCPSPLPKAKEPALLDTLRALIHAGSPQIDDGRIAVVASRSAVALELGITEGQLSARVGILCQRGWFAMSATRDKETIRGTVFPEKGISTASMRDVEVWIAGGELGTRPLTPSATSTPKGMTAPRGGEVKGLPVDLWPASWGSKLDQAAGLGEMEGAALAWLLSSAPVRTMNGHVMAPVWTAGPGSLSEGLGVDSRVANQAVESLRSAGLLGKFDGRVHLSSLMPDSPISPHELEEINRYILGEDGPDKAETEEGLADLADAEEELPLPDWVPDAWFKTIDRMARTRRLMAQTVQDVLGCSTPRGWGEVEGQRSGAPIVFVDMERLAKAWNLGSPKVARRELEAPALVSLLTPVGRDTVAVFPKTSLGTEDLRQFMSAAWETRLGEEAPASDPTLPEWVPSTWGAALRVIGEEDARAAKTLRLVIASSVSCVEQDGILLCFVEWSSLASRLKLPDRTDRKKARKAAREALLSGSMRPYVMLVGDQVAILPGCPVVPEELAKATAARPQNVATLSHTLEGLKGQIPPLSSSAPATMSGVDAKPNQTAPEEWWPDWVPDSWRLELLDAEGPKREKLETVRAVATTAKPVRWGASPVVRWSASETANLLGLSEDAVLKRVRECSARGMLRQGPDGPDTLAMMEGRYYAPEEKARFRAWDGTRQEFPRGAFPNQGHGEEAQGQERKASRLRGYLPVRWLEAADALKGRRRLIMAAIVRESYATLEERKVAVQVDVQRVAAATGLETETVRRTLAAMCGEGTLKSCGTTWDRSLGFLLFPELELSRKAGRAVRALLSGGEPSASQLQKWPPPEEKDAPAPGRTFVPASSVDDDRWTPHRRPNEQPVMARLRRWASEGLHETLAERRCAEAVRKGTVGVLVFDPDAEEAATAYRGRIEHIPFPETVVVLSDKDGDVLVCLAENDDGRIFAGCCGSPDPEARQVALRAAAFTADMGGLTSQEVNQGERLIVASGTWETLGPSRAPSSTSGTVRVGTKGSTGAPRGSLGHPRHRPQEHQVRGHWRMQRVGEGRQDVKRVWVSAHRRGGGVGLSDGGHKGRGKVYRVRLG